MNPPNTKTSQNRLRFEREVRGWSQQDLAEKVGTTQKIVSRWERGESTPAPITDKSSASILGKMLLNLASSIRKKPIRSLIFPRKSVLT